MSGILGLCEKTSKYADLASQVLGTIFGSVVVLVLLFQVFFRYVLQSPLNWYLDAAQFAFVWAIMMGFCIAYKSAAHIKFHLVTELLPSAIQDHLQILSHVLCLVFFISMVVMGFKQFGFVKMSTFETIPLSVQWMVLALPVGGLFMSAHAAHFICGELASRTHKD